MKEAPKEYRLEVETKDAKDGADNRSYQFVVVAAYPDVETAHSVAERLVLSDIPASDISVVVSEEQLQASVEQGVSIVPPAAYQGVRREGAVKGALWGGAAGLALGAEIAALATSAVFILPALAGATLLGIGVGAVWDAEFRAADLSVEGRDYRVHLHQGGAILAVHTRDSLTADRTEMLLRKTQPDEIDRHPVTDLPAL